MIWIAFEVRLANVFDEVKHHLDERARRLLLGAMAREIGHGGISLVAKVTATATDTVCRGAAELAAGIEPDGRIRRKGAGRKPVTETDPGILAALDELVDAESRGDPMRALRTAKLADELTRTGHPCSARHGGAAAQAGWGSACTETQKRSRASSIRTGTPSSGTSMTLSAAFQAGGQPVISVDTKKKELIGNYANAGTEWSREAERVNDHDFADKQLGKVAPYGVYDLTANAGG